MRHTKEVTTFLSPSHLQWGCKELPALLLFAKAHDNRAAQQEFS